MTPPPTHTNASTPSPGPHWSLVSEAEPPPKPTPTTAPAHAALRVTFTLRHFVLLQHLYSSGIWSQLFYPDRRTELVHITEPVRICECSCSFFVALLSRLDAAGLVEILLQFQAVLKRTFNFGLKHL